MKDEVELPGDIQLDAMQNETQHDEVTWVWVVYNASRSNLISVKN